jgi:integral membrane protein
MTPLRVFRAAAIAEALSWAGLLAGMFLKYVTETTELGVKVFGPIHGVVFIAFCLVTVLVAVNQGWSRGRTLLGLASSIPPFATVPFDAYAERRGLLGDTWRDHSTSDSAVRRGVCWLVAHYRAGALILAGAVAALTGLALLAGPPVG